MGSGIPTKTQAATFGQVLVVWQVGCPFLFLTFLMFMKHFFFILMVLLMVCTPQSLFAQNEEFSENVRLAFLFEGLQIEQEKRSIDELWEASKGGVSQPKSDDRTEQLWQQAQRSTQTTQQQGAVSLSEFQKRSSAVSYGDYGKQKNNEENKIYGEPLERERKEIAEENGQLYRNEEYGFRIKFPDGWEIQDGDGENIVKKAVKDGSTILTLVNEDFLRELFAEEVEVSISDEEMQNIELNDFSDEEVKLFLENIIEGQLEAFSGSTILDKGVRCIDNRKSAYFKMNQVYRVQDIEVEGISENYFTIHRGLLYQVAGFYSTIPLDESDKEQVINASLASFVFEDWDNSVKTNFNLPSDNVGNLKIQAQNEVLEEFFKSFVVGLFLVILATLTGLVSWLYSRIAGKNIIQVKKTKNGIIVASRVKRLINFSIDFFMIINGLFALFSYLAIQNAWYSFFEHHVLFWVSIIILYYLLLEGIFGRTLGKFITRTKVITINGDDPNATLVLRRTLSRLIPFEIISFMGKNPLGWHDRWSGTLVVNSEYAKNDEFFLKEIFCSHCGETNRKVSLFCKFCGEKMDKE
jgi:uncharacterized RDD family membrane protein YckC